jgi:YebC/PmpR family DNA-binding regulatory protein
MAGHSKWANIKHKKSATDKKKGKIFSKLAKEVMVAAKEGGGDADSNPRLRTALTAAKSANMPNANIDRAVKKGCGELEGVSFDELVYEGYGAEGVALLVECLTDNKNRSASEVRMTFDRNNGNLAGSGAVSWMFHRKSHFVVVGDNADEEKLMDIVLDAGAEDIDVEENVAEIWGPIEAFSDISKALEDAGIQTEDAAIIQHPENSVEIKDEKNASQVLRLIDALEDLDDVQAVHSNVDIAPEILEKIDVS